MGLFGKSEPQKGIRENIREWQTKLRKEGYHLDRQLRGIEREEAKVKADLKKAAKSGDRDVCVVYAKELVNSKKAKNRIFSAKAQMNSISCQLTQQLATHRIAQSLQKSAEVMKIMHSLVKVHEISATMQELSREMTKAGIIEEMMGETLDDVLGDSEEVEEEAAGEVDKVLWEITEGALGTAPEAVAEPLPQASGTKVKQQPTANKPVALPSGLGGPRPPSPPPDDEEEDEEDLTEMRKRLEALRS